MNKEKKIVTVTGALGQVVVRNDAILVHMNCLSNYTSKVNDTMDIITLKELRKPCKSIGVKMSDWTADSYMDGFGLPFLAEYVHEAPWSEYGAGSTLTFHYDDDIRSITTGSLFEITATSRCCQYQLYNAYYMFECWDYHSCGDFIRFAFENEKLFERSFISDGGKGHYYPIFMIDTGFWADIDDIDYQTRVASMHFKAYGEYIKWLAQKLQVFDSTRQSVLNVANSEAVCATFLCGLKTLEREWIMKVARTAKETHITTSTQTLFGAHNDAVQVSANAISPAIINGGEWSTLHYIGDQRWTATFVGSDAGRKTKFYHLSAVLHTAFAVPYWLHGSMITQVLKWTYDHLFLFKKTTMKEVRANEN